MGMARVKSTAPCNKKAINDAPSAIAFITFA